MCYNVTMVKIQIPHTKAYDAIIWASNQFGTGGYQVQNTFPGSMYEFRFYRQDQASLFALKWI
jgi:hypothetical protein